MSRLVFWIIAIIAASVLFLGVATAGVVTGAIAKTGGSTTGLVIGGIPTFVGAFRDGMTAGNPGGKGTGKAPGTSTSSWNGITGAGGSGVWTQAPKAQQRKVAPAKQKHGKHAQRTRHAKQSARA